MNGFEYLDSALLIGTGISLIVSWLWRRARARKTIDWPTAEATILSGAMKVVSRHEVTDTIPVFEISYRIGGNYFGGRFALRPYITDPGKSIIERMIGKKLVLRYDPQDPDVWFIPDKLIEGCRIEQKFSPHLISLRPSD